MFHKGKPLSKRPSRPPLPTNRPLYTKTIIHPSTYLIVLMSCTHPEQYDESMASSSLQVPVKYIHYHWSYKCDLCNLNTGYIALEKRGEIMYGVMLELGKMFPWILLLYGGGYLSGCKHHYFLNSVAYPSTDVLHRLMGWFPYIPLGTGMDLYTILSVRPSARQPVHPSVNWGLNHVMDMRGISF